MIKQVETFVEEFKGGHQQPFTRILEVGSRDVGGGNPANIRLMFTDAREYLGVDMEIGKNVDQVVNGHDLVATFGENNFDLVLCMETMEHDNAFWITAEQMRAVTKPGGWMIITVPGGCCPTHKHPKDYWRFMEDGVRELFADFTQVFVKEMCWSPGIHFPSSADAVMGWGQKPI